MPPSITATPYCSSRHLEEIASQLEAAGHHLHPMDFELRMGLMDHFIDVPPVPIDVEKQFANFIAGGIPHLKLTSMGPPSPDSV